MPCVYDVYARYYWRTRPLGKLDGIPRVDVSVTV